MSTVRELLSAGITELNGTSTTPRLDAELLLSFVTGLQRIRFIADPELVVEPTIESRYRELLGRRRQYEPIAYILGVKEFFGLDFEVSPAVLVPRPETEILVETALKSVAADTVRFLDLGTGSGCVAVALAHALQKEGRTVRGVAVDASTEALRVAERNIARHGLTERIELRCSDWFSAIQELERFDLIVSNPPYIAPGDTAISLELHHEPPSALYAEEGGLRDLRLILRRGQDFLSPGGVIVCEFGSNQRDALGTLAEGLDFFTDLAGFDRVVRLRGSYPARSTSGR